MIYNRGATGTTDPISSADMPYKTDAELAAQKVTGKPLSDDIVLKAKENGELDGQLIGFDALDGNVPGCYQYSSYITIRVKAVFDYVFTAKVKARKEGGDENDWKESVDARVGDRVEFRIDYNNADTKTDSDDKVHKNVMISDTLPSGLKYVPGTAKIYDNSADGKWVPLQSDDVVTTHGLNIGSYSSGSSASVTFTAEVVNNELEYGNNTLVNWGQASVGSIVQTGYAVVEVYKSAYFVMAISFVVFIISTTFFIVLVCKIIKLRKIQP